MPQQWKTQQGDRRDQLKFNLKHGDIPATPVDLSGLAPTNVTFSLYNAKDHVYAGGYASAIPDAVNGAVTYAPSVAEANRPGTWKVRVIVLFADLTTKTFPVGDAFEWVVVPNF